MKNRDDSNIKDVLMKYLSNKELNSMTRDQRLSHFSSMSVPELKLYFSHKITGRAYKDLCLIYNVKREIRK